jgi:hypothetical protein
MEKERERELDRERERKICVCIHTYIYIAYILSSNAKPQRIEKEHPTQIIAGCLAMSVGVTVALYI